MYVFRHSQRVCSSAELLSGVAESLSLVNQVERRTAGLLAAARLEGALADHLAHDEDDLDEPRRFALQFTLARARSFVSHLANGKLAAPPTAAEGDDWRSELARLAWLMPQPCHKFAVSDPEGFRYYALFPQAYMKPARELARTLQPRSACVIGLRTIGSALAPVVAATLESENIAVRLLTLRPRGDPFERRCRLAPRLAAQLAAFDGTFVIVDEGPGLSGSSFIGAAYCLQQLGIARERITLMPSWSPKSDTLVNAAARQQWDQWRKLTAEPLRAPPRSVDLGAGKWRCTFKPAAQVPVWPQQERAKYLLSGGMSILKFAGLGDYGRQAYERARELSACGFAPHVAYDGDGWLRYRKLIAQPLPLGPYDQTFAEWLGRYLAFIRSRYALGAPQPPSAEMQLMVKTNLETLLRRRLPPLPPDAVPVMLDARMLAHEFAFAGGALVKFDGVEHGDDHFFPGPADIAWDLAAIGVEFDDAVAEAARDEYVRRSGDATIARRLPWHAVAYTTFRAAWCHFAAERVEDPDRTIFQQQHRRYLARLSRLTAMNNS